MAEILVRYGSYIENWLHIAEILAEYCVHKMQIFKRKGSDICEILVKYRVKCLRDDC